MGAGADAGLAVRAEVAERPVAARSPPERDDVDPERDDAALEERDDDPAAPERDVEPAPRESDEAERDDDPPADEEREDDAPDPRTAKGLSLWLGRRGVPSERKPPASDLGISKSIHIIGQERRKRRQLV